MNWLRRRVKWGHTFVRCYRLSMGKKRGAGQPPRVEAIFMARCAAHIASTDPRRSYPKPGWLEARTARRTVDCRMKPTDIAKAGE